MQRATLETGIVLEYEAVGSGEPVVLVHGALVADAFVTLPDQPSLAGSRLISYRRRGYGGSTSSSRPLSLGEQAADCLGLLRSLGISRCHLAGHSFGGAVCLQLALDAPELVGSLVLLEPALPIGESGPAYRESLAQAVSRFREEDPSGVIDGFIEVRWPGYRPEIEKILPGAFEQAVADAPATFEIDLPGLIDWDFGEQEAARITQPVLSLLGSESVRLSPRFGEVHGWLQDSMPNVEARVIHGSHHFMQFEKPRETAEALAAFFARNPLAT
jgi:pimeloyl-ACP methyl ester carboxylesterase